ncbi:MAG: TPM domain-containing protein [Alphaproteobacteria bacterium]|nr:TPM domain-containing protein [Alphaproteobacteria bacterium]MBU1515109.1 TPM domain-containing protein [Alphaproteobacteria bacterium]MBU2093467.1 TPM domain-containing protein [Alphaproteobacteria bacterium]MBU2152315.1 TPM domain-containing protein [Alphaproteobacteria bacterium]MBU2308129.1 TPM domain-containing protein [Alphaproteobacteria bacterium]
MTKPLLTPEDLAAVEAAVRAAEARTTGEIYCVLAEESSDYHATPLAWAAGVALLAPAILLLFGIQVSAPDMRMFGGWTADQVEDIGEATARAALIGTLLLQGLLFMATLFLVSIPAVRRVMTPRGVKRDRVLQRAEEQFLSKNLHATRERTGVLIYVSATERMAELIADQAIHAQVPDDTWDKAMAALIAGLKDGRPAQGFTQAIGLCGEVLAERFPARPGDNPNELSDAVVVLPRP